MARNELADIVTLLKSGADPNEMYKGHTLWQCRMSLTHGYRRMFDEYDALDSVEEIFTLMLERGVDWNTCCVRESDDWERIYPVPMENEHHFKLGLSYVYLPETMIKHSKERKYLHPDESSSRSSWEDDESSLNSSEKGSLSEDYAFTDSEEQITFEEMISLDAAIEDVFEYYPDSAEKLLQLITASDFLSSDRTRQRRQGQCIQGL
jgi:hypothetical protein